MFQYAFAKSLAIDRCDELMLDLSLLGESDNKDAVVRFFDLDVFTLKEGIASDKLSQKFNLKKKPNLFERLIFKVNQLIFKPQVYVQKGHSFEPEKYKSGFRDLCVVGRFQSEKFFYDHKTEIKECLNFESFKPTTISMDILDRSKHQTAVGVQVRRGDYVSHPIYKKTIGALDVNYYLNAMELMKSKLKGDEVCFYVVSDDINWCREKFGLSENIHFVDQERSKQGYLSDMWLLSRFKHNIISNSTFSWWGAWIGESDSSIVIAPKNWTRNKENSPLEIVPERWLKIENGFEPLA
ncbi:MAG: alpha-1,2-fucosyltransferase [Flavobacteriales bacterium]|nr:alpha-1,2-fucosyltransferase [Flavobacteriales bacterium]